MTRNLLHDSRGLLSEQKKGDILHILALKVVSCLIREDKSSLTFGSDHDLCSWGFEQIDVCYPWSIYKYTLTRGASLNIHPHFLTPHTQWRFTPRIYFLPKDTTWFPTFIPQHATRAVLATQRHGYSKPDDVAHK